MAPKKTVPTPSSGDIPRKNMATLPEANFVIEVKCPSAHKAKRNDPKAPLTLEDIRGLSQSTVPDLDSDSGEEEHGMWDYDEDEDEDTLDANHSMFQEFEWLEPLNGKITLPDATEPKKAEVGHAFGKLIRRGRVRDVFYEEMEEPTEELSSLAFDMFDRYGRLKDKYKSHPVKKGSGIWGDEFDIGDLLLIDAVTISQNYQRQGLGTKLVKAMIEKARLKCCIFFAIVFVTGGAAVRFFRALGFRRIGSHNWFALASDANHASHSLAVADDYNPPTLPIHTHLPQIAGIVESAGRCRTTTNVHRAFNNVSMTKEEERTLMNLDEQQWAQVMSLFKDLPLDHELWGPLDFEGNTILHIAAKRFDRLRVDSILTQNPSLSGDRNHNGETALESVEEALEWLRATRNSDRFSGFNDNSIQVLIRLKGLTSPSPIDVACLRYGCTCGKCAAGFLSLRMRHALLCQAECKYDMLNEEVPDLKASDWEEESFNVFHGGDFKYLDPRVRDNLKTNKSMRQGFVNLFAHFAACLKKFGLQDVPVAERVMEVVEQAHEWPSHSKSFMKRGETIFSVGSLIFQSAKDHDLWTGDGEYMQFFANECNALPACRNDHEYGFVSGMCGYKRIGGIRHSPLFPIDSQDRCAPIGF